MIRVYENEGGYCLVRTVRMTNAKLLLTLNIFYARSELKSDSARQKCSNTLSTQTFTFKPTTFLIYEYFFFLFFSRFILLCDRIAIANQRDPASNFSSSLTLHPSPSNRICYRIEYACVLQFQALVKALIKVIPPIRFQVMFLIAVCADVLCR